MNQAPAEPRPASTPSAASGPAAVLRQLSWTVAELIIGGALLAARFLIPAQHDLLRSVTGGAAIGSLVVVVLTARFRYEVMGGRITARESDDLLRQAENFLEIVQGLLGLPRDDTLAPISRYVAPVSWSGPGVGGPEGAKGPDRRVLGETSRGA